LKEKIKGKTGFQALAAVLDYAKKCRSKNKTQNKFMDEML
jgi:hypothetical protein